MRVIRNSFTILSAILFVISVNSCDSDKKQVLTEKIQYDVPVKNSDPQLAWWVNNMEGSRREPFLKRIMEAAESGNIRVYDYFDQALTPDQILAIGSDTVYMTLFRAVPPYEEYDTMVVTTITYQDIQKIRFMEEWTWDPESLDIEKKVMGIGPVIQREINGESFSQLLFWISLDERFPEK